MLLQSLLLNHLRYWILWVTVDGGFRELGGSNQAFEMTRSYSVAPKEKSIIIIHLIFIDRCHGSFKVWFCIEGYYRQDLIFALNALAGSDFLISHPANLFCPETNITDLWQAIL